MRHMFRELKRAAGSLWRTIMDPDEYTSHAGDSSIRLTIWDILRRDPDPTYIPCTAGQHRPSHDTIDCTEIIAELNGEREAATNVANLERRYLCNDDTGVIPVFTDDMFELTYAE